MGNCHTVQHRHTHSVWLSIFLYSVLLVEGFGLDPGVEGGVVTPDAAAAASTSQYLTVNRNKEAVATTTVGRRLILPAFATQPCEHSIPGTPS